MVAAPPDRSDPREYFADMNWLTHHIIDTGREELKCLLERRRLVHRNHGSAGALFNQFGIKLPVSAVSEKKCLDCTEIRICRCGHPFLEFQGTKSGGGNAFTTKTARVT